MPASYVASASGAASVTVPGTAAPGDLLLIFAFRDGTATAPGAITGTTSLGTTTVTSGAARVAKVETWDGVTTSYASANATRMGILVYRTATVPTTGTPVTFATGTTNSASYPALSGLTSGVSWVARFLGHRTADASINPESVVPGGSGYTLRLDGGDTNADLVAWDTNGTVSGTSVAAGAATLTGTASGWISASVHIVEKVPNAKIATLTDDFSAEDLVKWTKSEVSAGSDVTFAGGQLSIRLRSGYPTYYSTSLFDLTESAAFVELVSHPGAAAAGSAQALLIVDTSDQLNGYLFTVEGNPLTISAYYKVGSSSWTFYQSLSYDDVAHSFLKIRHSGSTIYWDTSPDGSTWTNRFNRAASAFDHSAVKARLQAGDWNADNLTASVWDNFNVTGSVVETVDFTKADLLLSGSSIGVADTENVSAASLSVSGKSISVSDVGTTTPAALTLVGLNINPVELETVQITKADILVTGLAISPADLEVVPVSPALLAITGLNVGVSDIEVVQITRADLAISGKALAEIETVSVTPASISLSGRNIAEVEQEGIFPAVLAIAGLEISPSDFSSDVVLFDPAILTMSGKPISVSDREAFSPATLVLTGLNVEVSDTSAEVVEVVVQTISLTGLNVVIQDIEGVGIGSVGCAGRFIQVADSLQVSPAEISTAGMMIPVIDVEATSPAVLNLTGQVITVIDLGATPRTFERAVLLAI